MVTVRPIDHDRLFKELISTFILEFIDLFLPKLAAVLDRNVALIPLNKEIFTDINLGESHEVDLLLEAKLRGKDTMFLIHIEHQATSQNEFPLRMFQYFARLTEKYKKTVYPVVVYSHDRPVKQEADRFRVELEDELIMELIFKVIQLNRIPWTTFIRAENAAASALMATMFMQPGDRPKVKADCMRMAATLRLDPAKTKLIAVFVDTYLRLNTEEMTIYEREIAQLKPEERKATMELMTSWEEQGFNRGLSEGISRGLNEGKSQGLVEGKSQGLVEGKEQLVARLLRRRFTTVPSVIIGRLNFLTPAQLDDLGESLFEFDSLEQVAEWLAQQ